jgi:hypothetical protein
MQSVFLLEADMPLVIDLHDLQTHSGAVYHAKGSQEEQRNAAKGLRNWDLGFGILRTFGESLRNSAQQPKLFKHHPKLTA